MLWRWGVWQAKLDAVLEEFETFRETSMSMAEAKDAEVGKLLESNAHLREELAAAHSRAAHSRHAGRPQGEQLPHSLRGALLSRLA
jgi:hypothetical protein